MISALLQRGTARAVGQALGATWVRPGPVVFVGLRRQRGLISLLTRLTAPERTVRGVELATLDDDLVLRLGQVDATPVSPLLPEPIAALVAVADVATVPGTVRGWLSCVGDQGAFVFATRGPAVAASELALCLGLGEIEQRHHGRTVITSGKVAHI